MVLTAFWPGFYLPFEASPTPYPKSTRLLWFSNILCSITFLFSWIYHFFYFSYQVIFLRLNINITSSEVRHHSKKLIFIFSTILSEHINIFTCMHITPLFVLVSKPCKGSNYALLIFLFPEPSTEIGFRFIQ